MSYQYNIDISNSTPVVVDNEEVKGSLGSAKFHTLQCTGDAVQVDINVANNSSDLTLGTFTDQIENINAYGVTGITLTVASGSASVSLAGVEE
jgi:hypothetical protein